VRSYILTAVAALAVAGCTSINEGMSDIRRPLATSGSNGAQWVVRGQDDLQDVIQPNDTVLITIDRLYVSGFDELNFTPNYIMTGNNPFRARGEIAVLVAIQDGASPISNTTLDDHFVVYYSNDTREGQLSNFRNQRVFGPAKVTGHHLSLEVVLLEIDRPTDEDNALIGKLAGLGKQLGGVTSGPTFNVLADLGSSLLSTPNDDVEMRFRFNFDLGTRPNARLPLVPGLYAIVREEGRGFGTITDENGREREDRSELQGETDWAKLCLNTDTGELHTWLSGDKDGQCSGPKYVDNTYLVINVEAGLPESAIANERFSAFVEDLKTVPNPATGAFADAVADLARNYARDAREAAVWDALTQTRISANHYGQTTARLACNPQLSGRSVSAGEALTRDVVALHALLSREAGLVDNADAEQAYDGQVYKAQIDRLVSYFGSLTWGAEDDPQSSPVALLSRASTPSEFVEVFGDVSEFYGRVEARAQALWPDQTCPTDEEAAA